MIFVVLKFAKKEAYLIDGCQDKLFEPTYNIHRNLDQTDKKNMEIAYCAGHK